MSITDISRAKVGGPGINQDQVRVIQSIFIQRNMTCAYLSSSIFIDRPVNLIEDISYAEAREFIAAWGVE